MPTNKDFKRLVRARMQKTGEAYTAARANLLKRSPTTPKITAPAVAEPTTASCARSATSAARSDYAKLAGMSDAAIKKATGCDWEKWVFCARLRRRRSVVPPRDRRLRAHGLQSEGLVDAERDRRLRAHQRPARDRPAPGWRLRSEKSKTLNASAAAVFRAFAHARVRKHWLPGVNVDVRKVDAESLGAHDLGRRHAGRGVD